MKPRQDGHLDQRVLHAPSGCVEILEDGQRVSRTPHPTCRRCSFPAQAGCLYCFRCRDKVVAEMEDAGYLSETVSDFEASRDPYRAYGYVPENGYDGVLDNIERTLEGD